MSLIDHIIGRLHRDQRGTMSIVSVFTVLFLAMMMGMVMNVARQVDGKIRMQNAADAAAYSGATVIARAMNTLAFTNHLLCETFAMTAFLREANSRIEADSTQDPPIAFQPGDAEQFVPEILNAWRDAAEKLTHAAETNPLLQKFTDLGRALLGDGTAVSRGKIQMEQDLVDAFSAWAKQTAVLQLPLFEAILSGQVVPTGGTGQTDATDGMIPQYQRLVVQIFPEIAQTAAVETARRNGQPDFGRGDMLGALWGGNGAPVSGSSNSVLPVANPATDWFAMYQSGLQRSELSRYYLNRWNSLCLSFFDFDNRDIHVRRVQATMSQFANIWRKYDCGYLNDLLQNNLQTNHLYQVNSELYSTTAPSDNNKAILQSQYTFLATVYWKSLPHSLPGLFHDPTGSDAMAFAEARMFVPQPRLTWDWWPPGSSPYGVGGMGGGIQHDPSTGYGPAPGVRSWIVMPQYYGYYTTRHNHILTGDEIQQVLDQMTYLPYRYIFGGSGFSYAHVRPDEWSLLNQNWTAALVPATHPAWNMVLSTPPALPAFASTDFRLPNTGGLGSASVQAVSPH